MRRKRQKGTGVNREDVGRRSTINNTTGEKLNERVVFSNQSLKSIIYMIRAPTRAVRTHSLIEIDQELSEF